MVRKAGILMPVASLPGRFGTGDFGPGAYRFVDDAVKAGFSIWQILPLNPLGYGNSPYQPYSSFAIDELYLSLDLLEKEIKTEHVPDFPGKNSNAIQYPEARKYRDKYLRKAFEAFEPDEEYRTFTEQEWVKRYAVFMAFKKANNFRPWTEWKPEQKDYPQHRKLDMTEYADEIRYQYFLQYMVLKQWLNLKKYADTQGLQIMGDIPFYVGLDSADCWSERSSFLLDKDGYPRFIAGVPPDYFSNVGQRWGNPIYDWEQIERHGFRFWLKRISYSATLFDIIRLDHFRAFDTYWKIPASCPTAVEGEWIEAPGYQFFNKLFEEYPDINIIAEDLGDLRPAVLTLRDHYRFAGMNVLQFTFNPYGENEVTEHCLAYTGTHDNDTLRSFCRNLPEKEKRAWRRWFSEREYEGNNICEKFICFALKSKAEYVIIPVGDWLYLGPEGCLNHPGTVGSPNWEWRMKDFSRFEKRVPWIRERIEEANRAPVK